MVAYHIGDASVGNMLEYGRETYDAQAEGVLLEDHAATAASFGTYDAFFVIGVGPIASFARALATARSVHPPA
jgi:hypothetical protein